jgi:hypothetical protein
MMTMHATSLENSPIRQRQLAGERTFPWPIKADHLALTQSMVFIPFEMSASLDCCKIAVDHRLLLYGLTTRTSSPTNITPSLWYLKSATLSDVLQITSLKLFLNAFKIQFWNGGFLSTEHWEEWNFLPWIREILLDCFLNFPQKI